MLFEADETLDRLAQVVGSCTTDLNLHDDLIQEAFLQFRRKEQEKPDQFMSYYLKNCSRFLLDYLRQGRSLDSRKRAHLRIPLPEDESDSSEPMPRELAQEETVVSSVSAREILETLLPRLDKTKRMILLLACAGMGVRETAHKLGLAPSTVVKHFRGIRRKARSLGICPLAAC